MLRLWSSIIALILIFIACFGVAQWSESMSEDYIKRLEYAKTLTESGDWETAKKITKEVEEGWKSQNFALYTLLRHDDLDRILLSFQSVEQYLDLQDEEPYHANNAQLITQLKLLAEMEQLNLENIL